ncbi:MAG: tetratricopeptide repeat protein [Polyangiaceae bacterium]|nr:tetratricopeptide repeat protein [Polyangiaceae bacterium]
MRSLGVLRGALVLLSGLALTSEAAAIGASAARQSATTTVVEAEVSAQKLRRRLSAKGRKPLGAEKRVVAGELLLRTKDYDRSINELSQVVELFRQGKASAGVHSDALYYLAEAYFRSPGGGQLLSARRQYAEIAKRGNQSPYSKYAGRALGRLVDVALRTGDLRGLEFVFEQIRKITQPDPSGSIAYALGKAHFANRDFGAARSGLAGVSPGTAFHHQSAYLLGVILLKEAVAGGGASDASMQPTASSPSNAVKFNAAIAQFGLLTKLPSDTDEHRQVIDLAWMAIGRLQYETNQYLEAARAYSHIDRKSEQFGEMLYELAWVYVRLGDYQRAQRALEVVSISSPGSMHIADGSLLRADLMLRSGQFDKSLKLYQSVRNQFDPLRAEVDDFMKSTTDPAVYYDRLVEDPLEAGVDNKLPELALRWVREESEDDRVFAVVDDVNRSRALIKEARTLGGKLGAVLSSATRAKAFPELKNQLEATLGALNSVSLARRTLALGLEDSNDSALSGEIASVRAERRSLMKRLGWVPVTAGDFARREGAGRKQWRTLSQGLQRLNLEADRLAAIINGLRRVLRDADQYGVVQDSANRERFMEGLRANEQDLLSYRRAIKEYSEQIALGRVQVGLGDPRFVQDAQIRDRFRKVFERELKLAASGAAGEDAAAYARQIGPLLSQARSVEKTLHSVKSGIDSQVADGSQNLAEVVRQEMTNIDEYAGRLDALDNHARLLVGEVAMKNFSLVRDKLKNIVLRADVGIVQEAWELREEQRTRLRNLQRERAREEQSLNDELREVLDDSEEQE